MRQELSNSINRLESKFDLLEAGRLSIIESKVANLEGRIFTAAGIIAFFTSIIIGVIGLILKG